MRTKPRKGLEHIRTRSTLTTDAENPQRKFLRMANLELKKALCEKLRDAARKRIEEMDRKTAELEAEKAQLLAAGVASGRAEPRSPPASPTDAVCGSAQPRGFTLRY